MKRLTDATDDKSKAKLKELEPFIKRWDDASAKWETRETAKKGGPAPAPTPGASAPTPASASALPPLKPGMFDKK
jgi:hypothetical protein